MKYDDQEIIKQQMKEQQKSVSDIYSDYVWVGLEKLSFKKIVLFENQFEIMLPENYKDMPKEYIKIKYPIAEPPQIIKMNANGGVNFCFSLIKESPLLDEQVEEATKICYGSIRTLNPNIQIIETDIIRLNNKNIGYFGFISKGISFDVYQFFAYMSISGCFFQFIFNCPSDYAKTWNNIVLQVIQSIKEV